MSDLTKEDVAELFNMLHEGSVLNMEGRDLVVEVFEDVVKLTDNNDPQFVMLMHPNTWKQIQEYQKNLS